MGELEITKMLLSKGAQVNLKNNDGHSALMFACKMGELEIAKILYQLNKKEIYHESNAGRSCFMYAASEGRLNICGWLLED
jgi:ankyrin repeat protein